MMKTKNDSSLSDSPLLSDSYEYGRTRYQLASFGVRLVALIVDTILVGAIGGALGADSPVIGGVIGFMVGAGYHWLFLTRNNGQTPGKMFMRIQVVKVDGTPINAVDAVIRYAGYGINSALFMLGWLWALVDDNQQGFHDKLARTYVVRYTGDDIA